MLPDKITLTFSPKIILVTPLIPLLIFLLCQLPWSSDQAPAWVQAIGAVLAIVAAWIVPYRHELAKEKRNRENVLETVGAMAIRVQSLLNRMESVIEAPELRHEDWRQDHQQMQWQIHREVIDSFPTENLIGFDVALIYCLKSAARFGQEFADELYDWDYLQDELHPLDLRDLNFYKIQIKWVLSNTLGRKQD